MTFNEIKDAVLMKLHAELPSCNIYTEAEPGGVEKPALLIKPISTLIANRPYYQEKNYKVKLLYYSLTETYQDLWNIADALSHIFGSVLTVDRRSLTINSTSSEIIENDDSIYLQFIFEFDCIDGNEVFEVQTAYGETEIMLLPEELGYTADNISMMEELELKEQYEQEE